MTDLGDRQKTLPRLFQPDFRYIPAKQTNLRATFQRIRSEQQRQLELPLDFPPIDPSKT